MPNKVLVVVSSGNRLEIAGGKSAEIGTYLNETVIPTKAVLDAGYEVVLASPTGKGPHVDPHSDNASHFGGDVRAYKAAKAFWETSPTMQNPRSLTAVLSEGLDEYVGFFAPGGHAPIIDLVDSSELGEILAHFHANGKPTALLCHGPIALISALPAAKAFVSAMKVSDLNAAEGAAKNWHYAGYRMTIFSNPEEKWIEDNQLGGPMLWHVVDALQAAGGEVEVADELWAANVVEDRELITGQNPHSDHAVAKALLAAIQRHQALVLA